MIFIGLAVKTGTKAELPLHLRKASLTFASTMCRTGVCIPIGNTEKFFAAIYKSPQRSWSDTDITERLYFRNKSILADDLNAKYPLWNSKF
jgi:hypothetical protein